MASSTEQEGTPATAAGQDGSLTLGESSAERTENETNTDEDADEESDAEAPTKVCSACGKQSDAVKKCTACKCVWYCDKKCQKKHRKEHKHECRVIKNIIDRRGGKLNLGEELDIGPLEKVPPREECPICMRVMPIHQHLHSYAGCCGKTLCRSCEFQHQTRSGEMVGRTCAFCRTALPKSDEEILVQIRKRVELNDPVALWTLSLHYGHGRLGLPVDQAKCVDLLRQAADLGCPSAQFALGSYHHTGEMGLEQNEEKAFKCWEKAAEGGHLPSVHNLGCVEADNGDNVAAMRHWRLSASGGSKRSMANLVVCFEDGLLRHGALAETLQAMYRSRAEMRSKDRDMFIEHLKTTGEYEEEYDF